MAFRGMYDVEGHGIIPVYDYESEVPKTYLGKKVGIVETTASYDLLNRENSIYMSPNPGPLGLFVLAGIVFLVVVGAVLITYMLTVTKVTKTEEGYYVQVPGAVYWVDEQGNIISQQGTPTLEGFGDIIKTVVVAAVILGSIFVTFKYIIPALAERRKQ